MEEVSQHKTNLQAVLKRVVGLCPGAASAQRINSFLGKCLWKAFHFSLRGVDSATARATNIPNQFIRHWLRQKNSLRLPKTIWPAKQNRVFPKKGGNYANFAGGQTLLPMKIDGFSTILLETAGSACV
jgi:hypothetical protein